MLALEDGFNGIAVRIGLAGNFYRGYAGEMPLQLKFNSKTGIPSAIGPPSPLNANRGRCRPAGRGRGRLHAAHRSPAQERSPLREILAEYPSAAHQAPR